MFFLHLIKVELLAFVQNEGERVFSFSLTVLSQNVAQSVSVFSVREGFRGLS